MHKKQTTVNYSITLKLIVFLVIIGFVILILYLLQNNFNYYYSVSEYLTLKPNNKHNIFGIVKKIDITDGDNIAFLLSDKDHQIMIQYTGKIPAMFRLKQQVIVYGILKNDRFIAERILVKHDEIYSPTPI